MKIDDTIKEYFRQGVKLFYDTGETRTLKETFERTVVYFFPQGWELRNGVMAPILPPAEALPTLAVSVLVWKRTRPRQENHFSCFWSWL